MLRKPRIAYKVIGKNNRYGTNWTIFTRDGTDIQDECGTISTNYFLHKYKQYFPKYTKGKIIKKVFGTAGIMVFQTIRDCKNFQGRENIHYITRIVKVRMIGRAKTAKRMLGGCGSNPNWLVGDLKRWDSPVERREVPIGTVAIDAVEVLE